MGILTVQILPCYFCFVHPLWRLLCHYSYWLQRAGEKISQIYFCYITWLFYEMAQDTESCSSPATHFHAFVIFNDLYQVCSDWTLNILIQIFSALTVPFMTCHFYDMPHYSSYFLSWTSETHPLFFSGKCGIHFPQTQYFLHNYNTCGSWNLNFLSRMMHNMGSTEHLG